MNTFTPIISEALGLSQRGVENTLQLLDENCTIPFISRYRKEMTGNMDEVQVSDIALMREKLTDIAKRKETILSTMRARASSPTICASASTTAGRSPSSKTSTCPTSRSAAQRQT